MAVNFIISPTFEMAKSEILKKIASCNKPGTSHLVIVPDRHSLSYQRAVIEELGLVSVSNIEVVSFSRLADLHLTNDKRYLTPQSAVMLMRKVITKNVSNLKRYRLSSRNVGFADEMFAVVSDIRNSAISADAITARLEDIPNISVRNKVSDIALLYKGYIEELESKYFDATSKFGALIDIIDDIDIVKNSYVYVCDYYEFTNVELELLEHIMNSAKDMYISLVEKSSGANARIFPHLSHRLISMAHANDLHVEVERHDMPVCTDSLIYDNLFGYVNNEKSVEPKPCELYSAANIEEEISYIASRIKKSVRECGMRYRDIAIAVSDIEGYKDTIRRVMSRYDIPYFVDDKVPIMSAPSVRHILMALSIIEHDYRRADVTSFLMNGLTSSITNREKDLFTNYLEKYNIDRSIFRAPFTIEDEHLDIINSVRERLFVGFDILAENNRVQKMSVHIDSIYQYMDAIGYVDRVNEFAKAEFDMDYKVESDITTQAPKKLFKFFEELLMVAGDEEMSRRDFIDILLASLERVDISLIPQFNDSVYIGDTSTSRYDAVREMYFAGMIQGAVPLDMSTRGIIGQSEVDIFSSLGINLEPSPKEKNLRGRFYILELLLKARDRICLTYPLEGADGKVCTPSIVMRELADIYDTCITPIDRNVDTLSYMSTYANAHYITCENYGRYAYAIIDVDRDERKIAKYLEDNGMFEPFDYNDEEYVSNIHDLYFSRREGDDVGHMSASRVEMYLKCPYRAYLQYALGLREREVAEVRVADIGTILHGMLESLMLTEIERYTADKAKRTDDDVRAFAREYVHANCDYEPKVMHEIENRCTHVAVKTYAMLRTMRYMPYKVEFEFNEVLEFDGTRYKIRGFIDRVDEKDGNVYLVDYKSSSKVEFKLGNIYYGDRVQLVMYASMFATCTGKKVVGMFYLPMPQGFTKYEDSKEAFEFSGIMSLSDYPNMSSSVYPTKLKKTKSEEKIVATSVGDIVSDEAFSVIEQYVNRLVTNVVRDIKEGYIGKSPLGGKACEYCDFSNLCGLFGTEVSSRSVKTRTIEDFEEDCNE